MMFHWLMNVSWESHSFLGSHSWFTFAIHDTIGHGMMCGDVMKFLLLQLLDHHLLVLLSMRGLYLDILLGVGMP